MMQSAVGEGLAPLVKSAKIHILLYDRSMMDSYIYTIGKFNNTALNANQILSKLSEYAAPYIAKKTENVPYLVINVLQRQAEFTTFSIN